MAAVMKTPGVYIVEKNAFPNSVVEVATAVPAFIGYTEKAINKGMSLANKPWRITSMSEFHQYFGGAPTLEFLKDEAGEATENLVRFSLTKQEGAGTQPDGTKPLAGRDGTPIQVGKDKYVLTQTAGFYLLYQSMLHFFQNGGGPCYIVSVGTYSKEAGVQANSDHFLAALEELKKELEPTMIVMPEAVLLAADQCYKVQTQAIKHCGTDMKNRVALLDVWEGYREAREVIEPFRTGIGTSTLAFASAYYPWVNTSLMQDRDLDYRNLDDASKSVLSAAILDEAAESILGKKKSLYGPGVTRAEINKDDAVMVARYDGVAAEVTRMASERKAENQVLLARTLSTVSGFYNSIMLEMAKRLNVMPPSPAMAGVYTLVDNARGVWKAPANVTLASVVSPTIPISNEQQEDLNVTPQGKSVNAIRAFRGEGTMVWGARTLDGNSLDWRYVNVRRTMIMLEESIRLAAKAMVFEPNVKNTWETLRSMVANFLTNIWKRGGLAGAVPGDAFSVHVGLGETMTPEDILEGVLRVTVLVAMVRPAEFIEITFQQQMQKS